MAPSLGRGVSIAGVLVAASLLLVQTSAFAQSPGSQGSTVQGPHSLYWSSSVWNSRVPGGTIKYLFNVYNDDPADTNMTLKSLSLQTPWGNFSAAGLPASLCSRCRYAWSQFISIPTTQQPGNVSLYASLAGTYGSGVALCSDTGSVCAEVTPVVITSNSTALQTTVDNYSGLYLPVGVGIPAILAVILLVLYLRKPSA